mmetsp:Transcript_71935/g.150304  ORF Transcript_71935/g.150304 Transcript_71935/m.150304 type:complete len:210 (+) Transcript_71935:984-1613(+)
MQQVAAVRQGCRTHLGLGRCEERLRMGDSLRLRWRRHAGLWHDQQWVGRLGRRAPCRGWWGRVGLHPLGELCDLHDHRGGVQHVDDGHLRCHHCCDCRFERLQCGADDVAGLLLLLHLLHAAHSQRPQHGGLRHRAHPCQDHGADGSFVEFRHHHRAGVLRPAHHAGLVGRRLRQSRHPCLLLSQDDPRGKMKEDECPSLLTDVEEHGE